MADRFDHDKELERQRERVQGDGSADDDMRARQPGEVTRSKQTGSVSDEHPGNVVAAAAIEAGEPVALGEGGVVPFAPEPPPSNPFAAQIVKHADMLAACANLLRMNADKLAEAEIPDYRRCLIGNVDDDGIAFYVYGDDAQKAQVFAALAEIFGGEWTSTTTAIGSRYDSTTITHADWLGEQIALLVPVKLTAMSSAA